MSLKSFLFLQYSKWIVAKELATQKNTKNIQSKLLQKLIRQGEGTQFGEEHNFSQILDYESFSKKIPLRTYEDFIPYIENIKKGKRNILSQNKPLYLLMTSGTTAGTKYIPISSSGINHQVDAAKMVLCFYAVNKNSAEFINDKMMFLQGSPKLTYEYIIPCGRLSGVVYHHIPAFFQKNKLPKYETNIIDNWQEKISVIADETKHQKLSVIGGIPPWCIQYFELLLSKTQKNNLKELYPQFSCYIYGGLDFRNYKSVAQHLLGNAVDCLQTFPASEGFFALQDALDSEDMLLLVNQGIFYEFIPQSEDNRPICLKEVKLNIHYELVITNDSGLWRYKMGDLVQFTSLNPYRIKVVGRTSQFISAFGEHVIGYEIERAMQTVLEKFTLSIEDYHVSPNINDKCYEWLVEWKTPPNIPLSEIEKELDKSLSHQNIYYNHLYSGMIIKSSRIIALSKNTFNQWRINHQKEGGQNKVVRLANNQMIASQLRDLTTFL